MSVKIDALGLIVDFAFTFLGFQEIYYGFISCAKLKY